MENLRYRTSLNISAFSQNYCEDEPQVMNQPNPGGVTNHLTQTKRIHPTLHKNATYPTITLTRYQVRVKRYHYYALCHGRRIHSGLDFTAESDPIARRPERQQVCPRWIDSTQGIGRAIENSVR